jgi:hypothetical protein
MTIICVKDRIIAADTGGFQGSLLVEHNAMKIVRSGDDALGGACGESSATARFREWFSLSKEYRRNPGAYPLTFEKDTAFDCLWLEPDGAIWRMDWAGRPWRVASDFAATGAPYEMALGAMLAGASAAAAVRICILNHAYAAGEVVTARCEPVHGVIVGSGVCEHSGARLG